MNQPYTKTVGIVTCWYLDPECTILHRVDEPAVVHKTGKKEWWLNGKRRREFDPTVEPAPGRGEPEWWLNGKRMTEGLHSVESFRYIVNRLHEHFESTPRPALHNLVIPSCTTRHEDPKPISFAALHKIYY